ncbi:MAG: SPASM domain-containing protein, partial [Candidatus Altiarchaeota archaeon]
YPVLASHRSLDYMIDYPLPNEEIVYKKDLKNASYLKDECLYGRSFCYIDSDGKVYPCMTFYKLGDKVEFNPKSVLEVGFEEAWENFAQMPCISCYEANCAEWNYLSSIRGLGRGVYLTLKQVISK